MVAYEFLRALNATLDPAGAASAVGGTKSKSAAKKTAVSSSAAKGAVLGRLSGLHRMTAFGLKYCHLSKRTVELLAVSILMLMRGRTHKAPT